MAQSRLNQVKGEAEIPSGVSGGQFASDIGGGNELPPDPQGAQPSFDLQVADVKELSDPALLAAVAREHVNDFTYDPHAFYWTPVPVEDRVESMLVAALSNPNMGGDTLADFSLDERPIVRSAVAGNTSTPAEILNDLSRDDSPQVLDMVAQNPSTPPEALDRLYWGKGPGANVHFIRDNPNTPPVVLEHMSTMCRNDRDLIDLLRHSRVPRKVLVRATRSESSVVRAEASRLLEARPPEPVHGWRRLFGR